MKSRYNTTDLVQNFLFAALLLAAIMLLTNCAGLEIVTHTPYGSASYQDGKAVITPAAPITIPIYREK